MPDPFPSRGLVSSLYRLAPPDAYPTDWERERRLKVAVQRLVTAHGQPTVVQRVREYPVREEQEGMRGWIVLTAWAAKDRERSGTM